MINGMADGFVIILGFIPVVVMSIFWIYFTKGMYRRLRGESNDTVKLEKTTQFASLPLLITILVQIVVVGLLWLFNGINLIPVVALNFLYFYLSMMSVRFILTHLDTIEGALLKYEKKEREKVFLDESVKLVYDKIYYINLVGAILGVILIGVVGFFFNLHNVVEIFIVLGYYILFGYMSIIYIPDYIKIQYIDIVKDTLLEDGAIDPSQHYEEKNKVEEYQEDTKGDVEDTEDESDEEDKGNTTKDAQDSISKDKKKDNVEEYKDK